MVMKKIVSYRWFLCALRSFVLTALFTWMQAFAQSPTNCLAYKDFTSTAGLALVGSCTNVAGALRVTPAAQDQLGNAWLVNKQFCAAGFDTGFQFQFTEVGSFSGVPSGAD